MSGDPRDRRIVDLAEGVQVTGLTTRKEGLA